MAGTKRRVEEALPLPVIKRLSKEYSDVLSGKHAVEYVGIEPTDVDNLSKWKGWLKGPVGTPYEGGLFRVGLSVSSEYPFKPPGLEFETKIYHCNIDSTGGVCLNLLKKEWSPSQTLISLMQTLYVLLSNPNPDDPLVPAIAKQYRADRETHNRIAREWTLRYAITESPAATTIATAEHASELEKSSKGRGRSRTIKGSVVSSTTG